MRNFVFLTLLLTLCSCAGGPNGEDAVREPNVLFLFTDDQRFDTIHALGQDEIQTPNLDRLAAMGTAFTRAHIMGGHHGAICAPSRAMLMTGRGLFDLHESGDVIPEVVAPIPDLRTGEETEFCRAVCRPPTARQNRLRSGSSWPLYGNGGFGPIHCRGDVGREMMLPRSTMSY